MKPLPGIHCALLLATFVPLANAQEPGALEILAQSVSYQSIPGSDQVAAYADYLRGILLSAGFAPQEVKVEPFGAGAERTATLVARYAARNSARKPLLLIGHLDVVPARRADWQRDPFTAVVENGYVYGRGAYDNKFDITAIVTTLARLKRAGWRPGRDVILALSGDEETSAASAKHLARQLAGAELALNGDIGGGLLAPDGRTAVLYELQAGEKTYTEMTLTATDAGGHSSRPTRSNAIYRLTHALARIEAFEFPVLTNELTRAYFAASAPNTPDPIGAVMRRYVANPGDADSIAQLSADPEYVGQLRTTCVATQVEAGHAANALPQRAVANINCRIFPGTSAESVKQTLIRVIGDPAVQVAYNAEWTIESKVSPLRADVLKAVGAAVHARYPKLPIVPTMSAGSTDGTHYRNAGVPTYGVSGLFMRSEDNFAHGRDERVPVTAIDGAATQWERIIRELAR